ncbi:MAG: DsbA family protein [Geovibrio sp.]|nr:DsbA family protein [Geovibrio sp.]
MSQYTLCTSPSLSTPKAELYARVFEAGMAQNANFYDDLYSTTPDFDAKTDAEIIDFFAAKTADAAAFKALVNDNATVGKVAEQMQAAQAMGVSGTPALYFNGKLIGGFKPPMFDLAIETFK